MKLVNGSWFMVHGSKKKILFFALSLFLLFNVHCSLFPIHAADIDGVIGTVTPPSPIASIAGNTGEEKLGTVLSSIITVIFAVTAVVFVFMIVIGAFQWTISGGDKEAIANARKRIVHAIIGITLLALSFVIITVIGAITGFEFYKGQNHALQQMNYDTFTRVEQAKEKRRGGN